MSGNYRNILLGTVSGLAGTIAKNVVRSVGRSIPRKPRFLLDLRPRPSRTSKFTSFFKYGFDILGGIGITRLQSRTRENKIEKGVVSGFVVGSITDELSQRLSKDTQTKSTFLTILSNVVYGLVTTLLFFKLDHSIENETDALGTYLQQVKKEVKGEQQRAFKPAVSYRKTKTS